MEMPRPSISALWEAYGGRLVGRDVGGWRKALCVLHDDKTPSATINEDEGKWKCFVCDAYGDAIDLIMRRDLVGFRAACKIAEAFGGVQEVPETGLVRGRRPGRRAWRPPWLMK